MQTADSFVHLHIHHYDVSSEINTEFCNGNLVPLNNRDTVNNLGASATCNKCGATGTGTEVVNGVPVIKWN